MKAAKTKGNRLLNLPPAIPQAETARSERIGSPAADREWKMRERMQRAEDALHTLTRAEEHRADKQLMADVARVAAKKSAALKAVTKRK